MLFNDGVVVPDTAQQLQFAFHGKGVAKGIERSGTKSYTKAQYAKKCIYILKYANRNALECLRKCAGTVALGLFWKEAQHHRNDFGLFVTLELR